MAGMSGDGSDAANNDGRALKGRVSRLVAVTTAGDLRPICHRSSLYYCRGETARLCGKAAGWVAHTHGFGELYTKLRTISGDLITGYRRLWNTKMDEMFRTVRAMYHVQSLEP